jgi:flagellar protein FlaG
MSTNINQLGKVPPPVVASTSERAAPAGGAKPASAAAAAQSATAAMPPARSDEVRKAASQVNEALKGTASSDLQFSVEGDNKEVVVRVVDSQTKEVIRQIPSEQMVAISKAMDNLSGLLVQQKA